MSDLHIQNNKSTATDKGYRAFSMLMILFVAQICGYGYLVNASVGNVVKRMDLEKKTDELLIKMANLESSYFSLQSNVTPEEAERLNYISTNHVQYVDQNGEPVIMLSRN